MYIYILDYNIGKIYKNEIPENYINNEGEADIPQFMADNNLNENTCSWLLTDEDLELEQLND